MFKTALSSCEARLARARGEVVPPPTTTAPAEGGREEEAKIRRPKAGLPMNKNAGENLTAFEIRFFWASRSALIF